MDGSKWTFVCGVCVVVFSLTVVNSQTTQGLNGTQPSTSDKKQDENSVLDQSMVAFYNMVKGFLTVVQSKKIADQPWFNLTALISGDFNSLDLSNWQNYTNYAVGFAVCFFVGIIFCIVMPIVGCCFCCCRCCNRCGGRRKPHDPKRAKCKRVSYCTVLLILTTVTLAGVVCAFVANDLLNKYLKNENNKGPVGNIESALTKINDYVNDTVNDVQLKALGAFDRTRLELVKKVNTTASGAVDTVANMINANKFIDQAVDLSKDVNATREDLLEVQFYLTSLQDNGTALTTELDAIKQTVQSLCTGSSCTIDASQYETDANFTGLSDLSTEAGKVATSLDMTKYIDQAKTTIETAKANATSQIQTQIDGTTSTLDDIRGKIERQISQFRTQVKDSTKFASDASKTIDDIMTPEVKKYFDYVFYACIGLCSVYLLIVVCYYLGVLFGMCGERPGYDAPCCNKGVGANFLMAGVGFSFLFSWLLMLFTVLCFTVGGLTYTEVCRYFDKHDPQDIKFLSDALKQRFDLSKMLYNDSRIPLDITTILSDCQANKPVYEAMKLENLVNLSSLIDLNTVNQKIDDLGNQNFNLMTINLVSGDLEKKIEDFGKAGLDSIPYGDFDAQMSKQLVKADLNTLATQLRDAKSGESDAIKSQLEAEAVKLETLDQTYITNMKQDVTNLNASLTRLRSQSDIKNKTQALINGLQLAQDSFNANSSTLVAQLVKDLAGSLKTTTKTNVDRLISDVTTNVGKCRPVYDAVYQLSDAMCKTVLDPFNSLWFSWGWCLFFFIPSIIFAVKLAGLYRREEEYTEKDFDDANFSMYGGGPTPDTIPLTSVDNRHGNPGVTNSGYRPQDDRMHRGGRHSNGYPPHSDSRYPGSKDPPPPAYSGGGSHSSYPPKYDHDSPRFSHGGHQQRHNYPRY